MEKINKKLDSFSSILQQFGLQFIQSLGELKHSNGILADKIDKVEKEVVSLKGLEVQLREISKTREQFIERIKQVENYVQSLHSIMNSSSMKNSAQNNPTVSSSNNVYESPSDVLIDLERKIKSSNSSRQIMTALEKAKESIYVLTGGHKILFKIREYIRKLKPNMEITESFKNELFEKLDEWKHQF